MVPPDLVQGIADSLCLLPAWDCQRTRRDFAPRNPKSYPDAHTAAVPDGIHSALSCPTSLESLSRTQKPEPARNNLEPRESDLSIRAGEGFPSALGVVKGAVTGSLSHQPRSCDIPTGRQIPDSRDRGAADLPGLTLLSQECI